MAEGRAPRATGAGLVPAVAHELRSPIAAVREAAAQLRARGDSLDASKRDRLLAVIERAGDQLFRLVDDLASIASLDDEVLDVHVRACDPREIVEQAIAAVMVSTSCPVVRLDATESIPDVVADPGRLRQVVTNLLENAVKYSPADRPIVVLLGHDGDTVRISVRDEGAGIAAADLERIFEPSVQLGDTPGSGLGLWIVRELTTAMGGTVSVESEAGRGSTFTVELRVA